jgi:acyl-CoA synthetase (NDP forming)
MTTHTGAMAVPEKVLEGVLDSLGVVMAETAGESFDVAEMMARSQIPAGGRAAIVTHSGGIAIHLADLAESSRLELPQPSPGLQSRLEPLLDLGTANNPLDMGAIIGGPARFAEVVDRFARSGEYDMVLAVSTAHPPAHSAERVETLLDLVSPTSLPLRPSGPPPPSGEETGGSTAIPPASPPVTPLPSGEGTGGEGGSSVPILHLWMAGDQAAEALRVLREAGAPVIEEPRAAIRALAGLACLANWTAPREVAPLDGEFEEWGLPLVEGAIARTADEAVEIAEAIGYPVVVKVVAGGLAHKTEVGGVRVDLRAASAVGEAIEEVTASATASGHSVEGVRVERYRPGLEMIVGGLIDPVFGPLALVGVGGVLTELLDDIAFAPAPVDETAATAMIDRLRGRALLDGFRGTPAADVEELARIVSLVSRGLVGGSLREVEVNPLIWDGESWLAVDWLEGARTQLAPAGPH